MARQSLGSTITPMMDTEPQERARAARRAKRVARIQAGAEGLERWLDDLVTFGLSELEVAGAGAFERQAARLVDAQAPGLARRVRELAELPGAGDAWPELMLARLGELALLCASLRRLEGLPAPLRAELLAQVGVSERRDEVLRRGERARDRWQVVAQVVEVGDDEELRTQRSWLVGEASGQTALILQHAWGERGFAEPLAPGSVLDAELAFFPGALPWRALITERGEGGPMRRPFANRVTVTEALEYIAGVVAQAPWTRRFGVCLAEVRPALDEAGDAWIVDAEGVGLPVVGGARWPLIALSGGHALHLAGEWDGRALRPLGAWCEGRYHALL